MSQFEGKFKGAEVALDTLLLARSRQECHQARHEAIARYLSLGDGWDQAIKALDGAFAGLGRTPPEPGETR